MSLVTKTRNELHGIDEPPKPGKGPPCADEEGFRELGQTETWPRSSEYRHPKHTLADMMVPGYFTGELRKRMHTGDEIHYILYGGSKNPCAWERGVCVVADNPNTDQQPLILAGYVEYPQPTPWRDDGKKVA
jgi:hypothetical protein